MLELPKGLFRLAHGLAVSHCQQVTIRGVGHGISRLVFDGAVSIGIDIDQSSFKDATDNVAFVVEGVEIATTQNASGTALRLRQVPSIAVARHGYRFYQNDVLIAGDSQQTQGWAKAETLIDVENVVITSSEFIGQGYNIYGAVEKKMMQSAAGLEVLDSGCTVPGPITVVASNFYAWGKAVSLAGCVQGVNFTAVNIVSVGYGIYWSGTPGNPGFIFDNGHINAFVTNIYLRGVPSVNISHSLFYIDPGSATRNSCMLDIGASTFGSIDHNELWAFISNNRSTTGRPSSPGVAGICLQDGVTSYSVESNKFFSDGPVPASGTISFARNLETGQALTLGTTTVTFVGGAPNSGQVQIGPSLQATLANLLAFLAGSQNAQIASNTYALVGEDPAVSHAIAIVSKTQGMAGNGLALEATGSARPNGAALAGGSGVWAFNVAYQIAGGAHTSKVVIEKSMYSGGFNFGYYYDPNKPARSIAYGAPAALLVNRLPLVIPDGVDTTATYSASKFDSDGFYHGLSSLNIPAGTGFRLTRVCAGGAFDTNSRGYRRLRITRNGRADEPGLASVAIASLPNARTPLDGCTGLIEVAEGDTFAAEWFQNSGGALGLQNAWLSIEVRN